MKDLNKEFKYIKKHKKKSKKISKTILKMKIFFCRRNIFVVSIY